ncbi:hypothetical protein E2C01_033987 [Portunus trituberculatus]|uniref:Uncharacterized protein n=1 Tax=Portunus trituberculatus TaxID=210409 RepID=A0A5B7F566_PORTR|nr:hypothetical protein [Portunus trituberculatus]
MFHGSSRLSTIICLTSQKHCCCHHDWLTKAGTSRQASSSSSSTHAFPTLSTIYPPNSHPPHTTLRRVAPAGLLSRLPLTLTYRPVCLQTRRTPPTPTAVLADNISSLELYYPPP